ncbi:hypothetical protein Q3G72_024405 [Acer saccharum]|nr:hypothetical protein Q3G72_024405 [Acer saccharum]
MSRRRRLQARRKATFPSAAADQSLAGENSDELQAPYKKGRYQIAALKDKVCWQWEIAEILQRSKATMSRELRRNRGQKSYRPKQAQEFATTRCARANKRHARTCS